MGLFKRQDSPYFWISYTYNGIHKKESTGTADKKVAEAIYAKVKTLIIEDKWFDADQAKRHSFDELVKKFMAEHSSKQEPSTQRRYKGALNHLNTHFSNMLLSDVTPIVISDYIAIRRDEGAAPSTINKERNLLSKAFNLAWKQWGWVRENPCQKVPREKENNIIDRWLTPENEERLLLHAQGYLNGQLKGIIIFALHTGMREEEILNLIWDNVDLFRKVITVMKTKNKKPKTIPMTPTLYEMLKGKSRVVAMSGYIFHTSTGTKIMTRNLVREFYKAREKAGIPQFRFHDLRHTAGTRMSQNGIDLYTIANILGHKDIRSTMRYAHHCPDSLRPTVNILNNYSVQKEAKIEAKIC